MMLNKNIEKNIRIMFPENAEDRTQRILQRLRDDKAKDEHVPGSLTWIGRCAVDRAAADLIEQLEALVPRWIPMDERFPPMGEVLISHCGYVCIAWHHGQGKFETGSRMMLVAGKHGITHWTLLPEPPKEDANE